MVDKASFYFANLGADVMRCALAVESESENEYQSSLKRAHSTLRRVQAEGRPEAYEEGLLLLRALEFARSTMNTPAFREQLNSIIAPLASRLALG